MSANEYRFVRQFVWLASKSMHRRRDYFSERRRAEHGATLCHMTVFREELEFRHVFTTPKPTVWLSPPVVR
jgi:hypothetical protein